MTLKKRLLLTAAAMACTATGAQTAAVAMSEPWAHAMCEAWNADTTLTGKLVETDWIKNDGGRGFKVMQIYRSDCPNSARVELQIALKDNKAMCGYSGSAKTSPLNDSADYLMWADTSRWREMGAGKYGPMRAMMFSRLNFAGPKMEAMGNMGPFANFLLLVGKVPGDWASCP
jgi:putative sterol carrier protein